MLEERKAITGPDIRTDNIITGTALILSRIKPPAAFPIITKTPKSIDKVIVFFHG